LANIISELSLLYSLFHPLVEIWLQSNQQSSSVQDSFQLPEVYNKIVKALAAIGYPIVHPPSPNLTGQDEPYFPSKDLKPDAFAIRSELKRLVEDEGKPVVVLIHSYGGLVGSEATPEELTWAKRVAHGLPGGVIHLLYFAAFVLSAGQSVLGVFGESPNSDVKANDCSSYEERG
jgi:hypothetical protein